MKNIIVLFLVAVMLSAGCSKDKDESTYYVTFMVDGVKKSFTNYTFGHFETTGGFTELSMLGANSSTADDNYAGIYINNYPGLLPITTGVYEDSSIDFTVLATYAIDDVEYEGGQTVSDNVIQYNIPGHQRFTVIITEITQTSIRGTFSGDYYEGGDVQTGTKLRITNGEFNVQIR